MIDIQKALLNKDLVVVEVQITLLSTEDGGRKGPIFSGYRPNHRFDPESNISGFFIGEIQFTTKNAIYPGESEKVVIIFLKAGGIEEYLIQGTEWLLQEGSKLVGKGKILNIHSGR